MDLAVKLIIWLVQLVVGLGLAMFSVWIGVKLLGRLTKGIAYEEELNKGNIAIGAMLVGVVVAVSLVTSSGIVGLTQAVTSVTQDSSAGQWIRAIGFGVLQLAAGILFAVISIFLAFNIWDRLTTKIDEKAELLKGNAAIGIVMAGIIIAVSIVVRSGVSGLADAIANLK